MSALKKKRIEKYNVERFQFPTIDYKQVYNESIEYPARFWAKLSELVTWSKPWRQVLDNSREPFTKWFVGGKLNACYNAVDRHVKAGNGAKTALIYDSPVLGIVKKITYKELLIQVSKLAGLLAKCGVCKGDTVLIYMPLIPETVVAMLAVARLGAVHSVVFGGFAANELKTRIQHAEPKLIIAASCGIEPTRIVDYMTELNTAIEMSMFKPRKCIILQRTQIFTAKLVPGRDINWQEAVEHVQPVVTCVPIEANEPLYILYTSGTTGEPKGVQRPIGGHLVSLVFTTKYLYGMNSNDVWWATSDFGWQVGHSYMCYGPLCYGITSVIYEGKPATTPNPSSYFRIINDYKVNGFFTVPTVMRILRETDPEGRFKGDYDISSLRQIWLAGETLDVGTKIWTANIFGVPVMNHWWQTESGSPISGTFAGFVNHCMDTKLTTGLPVPGFNVKVLRKDGSEAGINEPGRLAIKLPLPPGNFNTLFKADELFVTTYFVKYPGYYDTMDSGYIDENGLVYVTGREDDIINVAGHRLSTLAIENIVLSHPDVCHACVVSVPDKIKNEIPLCLFVPKMDMGQQNALIAEDLISMVRERLGPVASLKMVAQVSGLPTTRTGKICRKSIADLARNKLKHIPGSVLDPTVFEEIEYVLRRFGFCIET